MLIDAIWYKFKFENGLVGSILIDKGTMIFKLNKITVQIYRNFARNVRHSQHGKIIICPQANNIGIPTTL